VEQKIRSRKVHDLIYDMYLREIQRGKVFIMKDIVFEISDAVNRQFLNSRKMQPFKVLLTPSIHQLTDDDDKNHLLKRTRSVFFLGRFVSAFILNSDLINSSKS
ncbi:hypothetical protein H5410_022433, partial [Solanum commersonii]